jgi:hypothetical protein
MIEQLETMNPVSTALTTEKILTAKETCQANSVLTRPVSVCLLISSLEYGGAERQVVEMFRTFDRTKVKPIICSLSHNIPLADGLDEHREDLHIVPRRWRFDFTTVFRLARLLRQKQVDVLHAFLFDEDIIGRLAAPLA